MYHYSIYQWLFFFYIYCFIGWCIESTYVSVRVKKATNRGFMRGPWLPIYGSGAIVMLFCAGPFMKYPPLVFLAGMIGASVLEFFTGEAMEALFKVRYWDYSDRKFNLKGQICLLNSFYWGILTIVMNYFVHNHIEKIVMAFNWKLLEIVTILWSIAILVDFSMSFKAAMDMREVLIQLDKAKREMHKIQKRLDVLIAVATDEVKDELDELKIRHAIIRERVAGLSNNRDFFLRTIIKGNPTMVSKRFTEALDTLKQAITSKNIGDGDD